MLVQLHIHWSHTVNCTTEGEDLYIGVQFYSTTTHSVDKADMREVLHSLSHTQCHSHQLRTAHLLVLFLPYKTCATW